VARGYKVVGIKEERELPTHVTNRGIPCSAFARVGLARNRDPVAIARKDGRRAIGRTIVDYDQLERCALLRKHTVDRVGDKRLPVVDRDNHADLR
jgi:hypothetical protein